MAFFAVVAVMHLLREDGWRASLVAGILGGFACGTTYRGIHTAVALAVAALVAGRRRSIWAVALGGAAAACPWYLRNFLLSGDPVYPFFAAVFPARHPVPTAFTALGWPDPSVRVRHFATGGFGTQLPLRDWLRLPWDATIVGRRTTGGKFDTDISPFYLAVLPSLFFVRPSAVGRASLVWLAFAFAHSVSWALGLWCTRYQLPAFATFAVVFPSLIFAIRWVPLQRGVWACSWLLLAILFESAWTKIDVRADARVMLGMESRQHYLESHEDGLLFRHCARLNESPEEDGPILMFGEKRTMYLRRPSIPDFDLDNVGALYRNGGGTAEGMHALLVQSGIHDILEQTYESVRTLTPEEAAAYKEFCDDYTKIVSGAGSYMLWRKVI
jgi:hypothetical protein